MNAKDKQVAIRLPAGCIERVKLIQAEKLLRQRRKSTQAQVIDDAVIAECIRLKIDLEYTTSNLG
jgi:hypothetical protein